MKTLYISDVDGTLTRGDKDLSPLTLSLLHKVVQSGTPLVLATGRNIRGTYDLATSAGLQYPSIVLNGALIYQIAENRAVHILGIAPQVAEEYCAIAERQQIDFSVSVFSESEQRCKIFYKGEYQPSPWKTVRNTNNGLPHDEKFQCDGNFRSRLAEGKVLYFGFQGPHDKVAAVDEMTQHIAGVQGFFHQSPYDGDHWFLDVVSSDSGKGQAAEFIKEFYGADELVTFGDNHNDIPLLKAGDRSFAMAESPEKVKAAATGVLDDDLNCVLRYIIQDAGIE